MTNNNGLNNMNSKNINRRNFITQAGKTIALVTAGMSLLPESSAKAAQKQDDWDKYDFLMPRVRFKCDSRTPDQWNIHPAGDQNFLRELSSVIRCKVKLQPAGMGYGNIENFNAVVDFDNFNLLHKYPFLFMTAEGQYDFNGTERENLKKYIQQGGFLLMDDCVFNTVGDYFYRSSCQLLEEVFGREALRVIDKGHEVYHNVYDFGETGTPYMQGQYHPAIGVFIEDRLAVFVNSTDIHCGWAGCFGKNTPKYKESIQMGINIAMYAISH